jgi:uncharacterized phage protein gp47/JayE
MATTFPLPTLAATVTAQGITAPAYNDIYTSLQASFQSIYGSDAYIEPDSQDGQLLAIVAKAISDSNDTSIAVYNSYSPATSQGEALSNAVKINGIARAVATSSSVLLRVSGQVGATISSGIAGDSSNQRWLMPAVVVIPPAGFIDVTATASEVGSFVALAGTITKILTPTLGWQAVTNLSAAAPGAPVETDAALRVRQALSTSLPSQTILQGILASVAGLTGVTQSRAYENDTNTTDTNGLPPHSIAIVVLGGVASAIANAIYLKKTPGAYTHGTTVVSVTDEYGIPNNIRFFIPTPKPIKVAVTIKALAGYGVAVGDELKAAVVAYINALSIGARVDIGRLYLPAQLYGGINSKLFEVNLVQISLAPAAVGSTDVEIAFNEIATAVLTDIALTVT